LKQQLLSHTLDPALVQKERLVLKEWKHQAHYMQAKTHKTPNINEKFNASNALNTK
jgi:hypothetical protein